MEQYSSKTLPDTGVVSLGPRVCVTPFFVALMQWCYKGACIKEIKDCDLHCLCCDDRLVLLSGWLGLRKGRGTSMLFFEEVDRLQACKSIFLKGILLCLL